MASSAISKAASKSHPALPEARRPRSKHEGRSSKNEAESQTVPLEIASPHLGGEAVGRAFPHNAGVLEHIDAVGMRQRKGNILLAEQHGDRGGLPEPLQRFRKLLENDRRKAERRLIENEEPRLG